MVEYSKPEILLYSETTVPDCTKQDFGLKTVGQA